MAVSSVDLRCRTGPGYGEADGRRGIANAPIMILMKQADISEQFEVNEVGQRKFLYWVELVAAWRSDLEYTSTSISVSMTVPGACDGIEGPVRSEHTDCV